MNYHKSNTLVTTSQVTLEACPYEFSQPQPFHPPKAVTTLTFIIIPCLLCFIVLSTKSANLDPIV